MSVETFRLYQTLAQDGVPYPTEPADPYFGGPAQDTMDEQILAAPSVWHVRELVNTGYDESEDDPEITFIDTGKRFNLFALGNGPCLGGYAETNGRSRAYLQEGTYLLGFWYNGLLFGIPLTVGDLLSYHGEYDIATHPEIIEEEIPDPIPCTPTGLPTEWEITISNWLTAAVDPFMENRTVVLPLHSDTGRSVIYQYEEVNGDNTKRWRVSHYCIGFVGGGGGESVIFSYANYNTVSGAGFGGYWNVNNPQASAPYYQFFYSSTYGTSIRGVKLS